LLTSKGLLIDLTGEIGDVVNVLEDWENKARKATHSSHLNPITGSVYWPADD
jgi:hypothetical protein